jgi:hypothetical protein
LSTAHASRRDDLFQPKKLISSELPPYHEEKLAALTTSAGPGARSSCKKQ